jgi:hypothetical protein
LIASVIVHLSDEGSQEGSGASTLANGGIAILPGAMASAPLKVVFIGMGPQQHK